MTQEEFNETVWAAEEAKRFAEEAVEHLKQATSCETASDLITNLAAALNALKAATKSVREAL